MIHVDSWYDYLVSILNYFWYFDAWFIMYHNGKVESEIHLIVESWKHPLLRLSGHNFHNLTLPSPTINYKDERMNEQMNKWVGKRWKCEWMKERMNEQVVNKRYILCVNIEWMSWWMPKNSRWCEWTSKYNAVYSSYVAHDNPVHVYLCLFTSDWLCGIHNANTVIL